MMRSRRTRLFTLTGAVRGNAAVAEWLESQPGELGVVARHWFSLIRSRGDDVTELLHDGQATACVDGAAFAYVGVFKAHVNVGFFSGATLPDPDGILQGTGKDMRHVRVVPSDATQDPALSRLIDAAYLDIRGALGITSAITSQTSRPSPGRR